MNIAECRSKKKEKEKRQLAFRTELQELRGHPGPRVSRTVVSRYLRLFLNLSSSDLPKQCNLFLYQSTVILDVDMWNVYKAVRADSDVFYCFLGDTCLTGRGFRDESCSRGLSTVTVGNVRFVASSF